MFHPRLRKNHGANQNAYSETRIIYLQYCVRLGIFEFHFHTDAFDIAVGAMLAQNPTGKIDQPIVYAS
jgi:hypothetical protein